MQCLPAIEDEPAELRLRQRRNLSRMSMLYGAEQGLTRSLPVEIDGSRSSSKPGLDVYSNGVQLNLRCCGSNSVDKLIRFSQLRLDVASEVGPVGPRIEDELMDARKTSKRFRQEHPNSYSEHTQGSAKEGGRNSHPKATPTIWICWQKRTENERPQSQRYRHQPMIADESSRSKPGPPRSWFSPVGVVQDVNCS